MVAAQGRFLGCAQDSESKRVFEHQRSVQQLMDRTIGCNSQRTGLGHGIDTVCRIFLRML